jgi:hypothetical protein
MHVVIGYMQKYANTYPHEVIQVLYLLWLANQQVTDCPTESLNTKHNTHIETRQMLNEWMNESQLSRWLFTT